MKKLIKWLVKIDDNLLHYSFIAFIILASLVPKFPIQFVEYTYIRIRLDDLFPALIGILFFIQWIRRKVHLNTKFLPHIIIFWVAVFVSFLVGHYVFETVPVFNIGLLHSLRRVQYMLIFFVASSIIVSDKRFNQYLNIYMIVLLLVSLYGIGQRFLQFPSIQSMNPAYVDGRLLTLNSADRINSTFGGHFDLAAYFSFSIPIIFGLNFARKQKRFFVLFIAALIPLLYTAARSSFLAYFFSITLFLLIMRKFKLYLLVVLITIGLFLTTGEMARRFQQTFQLKTVFVNEKTGGDLKIAQKYDSTRNLPAGNFKIPIKTKVAPINTTDITNAALEKVLDEARQKGESPSAKEIKARTESLAKFIKPQQMILCDIACSTRLQVEWPRALSAFTYSPIVGTGPSSITEATDNDFLRWLGETGAVGAILFTSLLILIMRLMMKVAKEDSSDDRKYIYYGYIFGTIALFVNAIYVDVFEASKMAYNFWLMTGMLVGLATLKKVSPSTKNEKRKSK